MAVDFGSGRYVELMTSTVPPDKCPIPPGEGTVLLYQLSLHRPQYAALDQYIHALGRFTILQERPRARRYFFRDFPASERLLRQAPSLLRDRG